tara:strand:+ start:18 stop:1493 length:1476 start_codon:yes stop_codon:yes gene_type:complete
VRLIEFFNIFEAREMGEKILINAPNRFGPRKGEGTADVFLDLLANNPSQLIDKSSNPIQFAGASNLLKIANQYQQKNKKPITTDQVAWRDALAQSNISITDLNKLEKTELFGTSAKERIKIKPKDIFDQPVDEEDIESIDKAISKLSIPGKDLAKTIIASKILNQKDNPLGAVIIDTTKNLIKGQNKVPAGKWWNDPASVKAVQDYAGEYLGVVGLLNGVVNFPAISKFLNFMGTNDLKNLSYYFPSKSNVPLADSFGVIKNPKQDIVMNISSKGGTKGASPSLDNIKITPELRKDPKYKEEIQFVETVQKHDSFDGIFNTYNLLSTLDTNTKKAVSQARGFQHRGFGQKDVANLRQIYDQRVGMTAQEQIKMLTDNNKKFLQMIEKSKKQKARSPVGFILYYAQRIVRDAVNKFNALPEFQQTVRTVLGDNFMQIYTIVKGDAKNGGTLDVRVLYPAKIDGKVEVSSKTTQQQLIGKLSFSISPDKGYFN